MTKQQLQKDLDNLQTFIFKCLSDLDNYDSENISTLYQHKKRLKFTLYSYTEQELESLTLEQRDQDFQHYLKASLARTGMKTRIKKKLYLMTYPAFITITFKDEMLDIDYKNELRKLFKRYHIKNYTLITDYGKSTGRIHFHGFIDCAYLSPELFEQTNVKNQSDWNFIPLNRFGHNVLRKLDYSNVRKAVNYITKYMVKDYRLKHESFNSRSKQLQRTETQFLFDFNSYCKKSDNKFFLFEKI